MVTIICQVIRETHAFYEDSALIDIHDGWGANCGDEAGGSMVESSSLATPSQQHDALLRQAAKSTNANLLLLSSNHSLLSINLLYCS